MICKIRLPYRFWGASYNTQGEGIWYFITGWDRVKYSPLERPHPLDGKLHAIRWNVTIIMS